MGIHEVRYQMGVQQHTNQEGDEHKAAFKTKYGLFEPRVMFFRLTNSPATFQAMTNEILRDLWEKFRPLGVVISGYMDDYLIATSSTIELHWQVTHELLDLIKEHDLFINPEKCVWESPRIDYLGLILERGVTHMDPAKIAGIAEWPIPTMVKQVRSFLGFCNYYWPFIYQYSHIAAPLNKLTRKDTPFQWKERQQLAFKTLRARLISEPVLKQPQLDQQFKIEVDTSGFVIGAVLMQWDKQGKYHPVAYFLATLTEAEQNYNIFSLELYTIIQVLHYWRALVAGSPETIIIHTDHANLQYWKEPHKIPRRIAREVME